MNIKKLLWFGFSKAAGLQKMPSFNQILQQMPCENSDLVLIRHGESTFNVACQSYRQQHKIPYVWKELCNHEGFDQKVLFNPMFIDCPLTELGKSQCKKSQRLLKNQTIDCVLVSPQLRALQTCSQIFKGSQVPVYVEPLLVGPLRSCSDVNRSTRAKKILFPQFNFNATQEYQELWYLDYLNQSQKKICYQRFLQLGVQNIDDQRVQLVKLLKQGQIYESAKSYRKRIQEVKYKLEEYKSRYRRIAVVSHYYTIEYLGAMDYEESGTPKYYIDIKNCRPYYASLANMLSFKEQSRQVGEL